MANILASVIIAECATEVQDESYDHWSQAEWLDYLNEAQRVIVILKPKAYTTNGATVLVAGAKQSVPTGGIAIADIICNMGTDGATPGDIVLKTTRKELSLIIPGWYSATASATAQLWIPDEGDPKVFYVYPPQPDSGQGYLQEVYSIVPPECATAAASITLSDDWEPSIKRYMLHKAYAKDSDISAVAKEVSVGWYSAFLGGLK